MARIPRSLIVLAEFCVHKTWRGHNREDNLRTDEEKLKYLEFLNKELESKKRESGSVFQAITLMDNHAHELFRILIQKLFSDFMRRHHSRYGQFFNQLRNRCGKVAQDRPHTTLLQDEKREMETVFYIHANPVRAKMVGDARDYRWSTHRLYAFGIREDWMRNIQFPSWYLRLGRNATLRQKAYRQLFALYLSQYGLRKQYFLSKVFYGNLDWIKQKKDTIAKWRREHPPPP